MKITGIKATLFNDGPAAREQHDVCKPPQSDTTRCLVELTTEDGPSGIAVAQAWARAPILTLAQAIQVGKDPRAVTALWHIMGKYLEGVGDAALQHARAVLDLATWDLKARILDEPLWKCLGGARPRANAYAACPIPAVPDDHLLEWFALMSGTYGLRGGKLAVGDSPDADLQRLGMVRDALKTATHAPELMIDAGGRWWPTEAARHIRKIESQYDLTFVQGAVEHGDFLASKRLSERIRAAVCIGGGLPTARSFLPYFHHHAANVIEIDIGLLGMTGALQVADTAYGFELPVTLAAAHGNIHVHLAAVIPNFMSMEVVDPEPGNGVIASDVRFDSGWGIAGDAPGNSLSVNRELLSRLAVNTGN